MRSHYFRHPQGRRLGFIGAAFALLLLMLSQAAARLV